MADMDLPFGAWLKRQRRASGLTQEALAAQVGCAPVTLRKLEAGARRPSKQVAGRLAEALGIPPCEQPAFVAYARADSPHGPDPIPAAAASGSAAAGPWQAVPAEPCQHNLPHLLTSFVGRAARRRRSGFCWHRHAWSPSPEREARARHAWPCTWPRAWCPSSPTAYG